MPYLLTRTRSLNQGICAEHLQVPFHLAIIILICLDCQIETTHVAVICVNPELRLALPREAQHRRIKRYNLGKRQFYSGKFGKRHVTYITETLVAREDLVLL